METLNALYELKDKADSLGKDDKVFVLETIGVYECGKRQLSRHEILRIADLYDSTRGIIGVCPHQLQEAVLTESGEPTDEYECVHCHQRFKIPSGLTYSQL